MICNRVTCSNVNLKSRFLISNTWGTWAVSVVQKYSSKAHKAKKEVNPHSSIHTFLIMAMNKSPFHFTLTFFPRYIFLDTASETDVQSRFEFHPRTSQRGDSAVDSASTPEWTSDSGRNVCWLQQERERRKAREGKTDIFSISVSDACPGLRGKSNIGIALAGKGALVFRLSAQS